MSKKIPKKKCFLQIDKSDKFCGNLLSRMNGSEIFSGINFREIGQKSRKSRKFLPAKVSSVKVYNNHSIFIFFRICNRGY